MSRALYRTWRPAQWDEVVGQEPIVRTLKNAILSDHVGHAYLFSGPRGTGKTTTARLLAKAVNCLDPDPGTHPCNRCEHCVAVNENRFLDLIEIDAASNTSVEDVRDLRDKINFSPNQGKFKIYIIDEVHMLSTAAFNALLKTLEEPPPHAIFILATTEVHKIPATVLSRCQRHEFRKIPVGEIAGHLQRMANEEGIQVEEDALLLISRQATGSLRDAISMLDQLASLDETVTLSSAHSVLGTATSQVVIDLVESILEGDPARGIASIHQALDGGSDPRQLSRQVQDYLRNLLLIQMNSRDPLGAGGEFEELLNEQATKFSTGVLIQVIRLFNQAASDPKTGWHPALLLELALAESIEKVHKQAAPATIPGEAIKASAGPVAKKSIQEDPPEPLKIKPGIEKRETVETIAKPASAEIPQIRDSGGNTELDINQVREHWRQIKAFVKERSKPTEALLNSCKLVGIREKTLVLGFATEVLKSKMDSEKNIELIRQAIYHAMQADLNLACIIQSQNSEDLPPDLGIEEDGMVGIALTLGGKIVNKE